MAYVAILDGDPCCYCGAQGEVVIDHIVPVVASRDSSWGNLTAACHSCNSRKNRRSLLMFLRGEQVRRQLAA